MNKLRNMLIAAIALVSMTSSVFAGGFVIGVNGGLMDVKGSGSETTVVDGATGTANVNKKDVKNTGVFTGSIFAEYSLDASYASAGNGYTIGVEHTPGAADVSNRVSSRTETPASGNNAAVSVTYKAQAEISDYINYYIELPVYANMYVRGGYSTIDVNTLEAMPSGSGVYGNKTGVNGTNIGVGFKGVTGSNIAWKLAYEQVDFDQVSLTNNTGTSKVSGDIDTTTVKLSLGYQF